MTLRVLSLFSGIGGIDLGLERAGMCVVAQCEIDPFCQRVLAKHWPEVPRHGDIRTYRPEAGAADLVAGGFPCQPWSSAGKQRGRDDTRHLWPEFARVVADVRPRWVLGENVPGIRGRGADEVLGDLEALGYACWPLVVAAADVGAPHERARVWFVGLNVADTAGGRWERPRRDVPARKLDAQGRGGELGEALAVSGEPRLAGRRRRWPSRPGQPQHEWEAPRLASVDQFVAEEVVRHRATWTQPTLDAATDGLPRRLARWRRAALKAVGNAVVPQVVELVGRAILAADAALRSGAGGAA